MKYTLPQGFANWSPEDQAKWIDRANRENDRAKAEFKRSIESGRKKDRLERNRQQPLKGKDLGKELEILKGMAGWKI
jgi:hypothetical protein